MKNQINILILILLSTFCVQCAAQKEQSNAEIVTDQFYDISFEKDKIVLTKQDEQLLNHIGNWIVNSNDSEHDYYFEVIPSIAEEEKSQFIEYKRVDVILKFFKTNYGINESKFTFKFYDPIPVEGIIRFSVR